MPEEVWKAIYSHGHVDGDTGVANEMSGEHLLHGLDLRRLGYGCVGSVAGERATHVFLRRRQ
jgi:hypothetical protein